MQINDARCGKRFLTYLIDMFIVGSLSQLILVLFPVYRNLSKDSQSLYTEFTNHLLETGLIDSTIYSEMLQNLMKIQGLTILVMVPVIFLYLVVLPMFWKPQTIGRLATGVRVMTIEEQAPSWKHLCLRELVGVVVFYQLLSSSIIIIIITWVFSATRGRSLADFIGGTRLVNMRITVNEDLPRHEERDYVDATFKEVEKDFSKEEEQENSSSNDNEYKVF